ncbi:DUF4123 domain-containing protein [Pseudomonas sp. S32]|uniref:DUF4123 domain-containing protein n=1 Tax=Pseudomonas sp. S32 TaxID=2767448 RepID=UPI0019143AD4|nr:DUF4123 domain-containing protein [Pseudomonas sp. S32]MBK5003667.1 hypothetical protein [Pseudomonas sp. S32]
MMDEAYVKAGWPRQHVKVVPQPNWPLSEADTAWLLLNGNDIPALADTIRSLSPPGGHHWVWRGTQHEYSGRGYQAGPLLARLNCALFEQFIACWGPDQTGLLLLGPDHHTPLLQQLQHVKHLRSADGNTLMFRWQNLRKLEELCEALPQTTLQRLFSPIRQMIWHGGLAAHTWLQQSIAQATAPGLSPPPPVALTSTEEAALNSASHALFMRRAEYLLSGYLQKIAGDRTADEMREYLATLDEEGRYFRFEFEDERMYYLQLRLFYPVEPFIEDRKIQGLLRDTERQGRQRGVEILGRLREISTPRIKETA